MKIDVHQCQNWRPAASGGAVADGGAVASGGAVTGVAAAPLGGSRCVADSPELLVSAGGGGGGGGGGGAT